MPVRILECIRQGQIGGGESHLLSLVENLNKEKFDPVVLSFTDGPMIQRLNDLHIPTHVIHTLKPFDLFTWKKVKQLLIDEKIQMVHAHGTRAQSNVYWAAKSLNLPLIYTIHGWSFHNDQNPVVKKIRIVGEKVLTSKADVNISVSQSNQQTGKNYFSNFNSQVVNNGIDQNRFNPERKIKNIRAEIGLSENDTVVLFIARFTHQKQPLVLIHAFAEAIKKDPSLKLLMVGDGEQKQQAIELIQELNIGDKVILQSFRQDIPEVLSAADIFVLPSLWEGLPIGLLEAMSMGKAIIASEVDGTKEIIENGTNGIMIKVDELQLQLPDAILMLAKDESLRNEFGNKSIATIRDRFNAITMTHQIENIYTGLLQQYYPEHKNAESWSLKE